MENDSGVNVYKCYECGFIQGNSDGCNSCGEKDMTILTVNTEVDISETIDEGTPLRAFAEENGFTRHVVTGIDAKRGLVLLRGYRWVSIKDLA